MTSQFQYCPTMSNTCLRVGTTVPRNRNRIIVLRCPEAVTLTGPVHPMQLMSKLEPTR